MKKVILVILYLLGLVLITFLPACNKDGFLEPKRNIELSIDTRLPKDSNGYSVFKLYSTETQNIHTITGSIRVNGQIPNEPREKVEWENNLYWNLVKGEGDETKSLAYSELISPLIKAVQELSQKNEELTARIEVLEG